MNRLRTTTLNLVRKMIFVEVAAIAAFLSLFISSLHPVWAEDSSDYGRAVQLYLSKDYAGAAQRFQRVLERNPANGTAAYYEAYSLLGSGKKDQAINLFWYVCKKCPASKEAPSAREYLRRIDPRFNKSASDPSVGILPKTSSGARTASAKPAAGKNDAAKDILIERLVQLTPRRSARADVTPTFVSDVKDALKTFPLGVLSLLDEKGCHILLSPNVIESDFRMESMAPGGYSEGSVMENVPALFNFHDVVLGQTATDKSGNVQYLDGITGVLRHEIGHAIDWYSGHLSDQEPFKHAFDWDRANYVNEKKLSYYSRPGDGGAAETFAELCCFKLGGETVDWRIEACNLLHERCQRCAPIVDEIIDNLEKTQPARN